MDGDRKLLWAFIISFTVHIAIVFLGNTYAPWKVERNKKKGAIVIQLDSAIVKPEPGDVETYSQETRNTRIQKTKTPPAERVVTSKEPETKDKPLEQRQVETPPEKETPDKYLTEERVASPPPSTPVRPVETWKKIYSEELRGIIEQNQRYPVMALRKQQQGTVMVSFNLDRTGRLLECHIAESCGHKLLDRAALRAVRTVASFPPFPTEFNVPQANFIIPVTFAFRK
jgi:protein TonB